MSEKPASSPARSTDLTALCGTWRAIGSARTVVATGETTVGRFPNPEGTLTLTPDGRVDMFVIEGSRRAPAGTPSQAEKAALFDTVVAFKGTFRVEGDRLIYRFDASWNQKWTGTEQVRIPELEGNILRMSMLPAVDWTGHEAIQTLIFERSD